MPLFPLHDRHFFRRHSEDRGDLQLLFGPKSITNYLPHLMLTLKLVVILKTIPNQNSAHLLQRNCLFEGYLCPFEIPG